MQMYIQDNPLKAIGRVDVAKSKRRFATNEKNVSKSFTTALCASWSVQNNFFMADGHIISPVKELLIQTFGEDKSIRRNYRPMASFVSIFDFSFIGDI